MMKLVLEMKMDGSDRALRVRCGKNKIELRHEAFSAPNCLCKYSIRGVVSIDALGERPRILF